MQHKAQPEKLLHRLNKIPPKIRKFTKYRDTKYPARTHTHTPPTRHTKKKTMNINIFNAYQHAMIFSHVRY